MSWEQLKAILDEARSEGERQRTERPVACPNDGEPLISHNGILHCQYDGWRWDG